MLRRCSGLSIGPSTTRSSGTPISTISPSVTDACSRIAATTKKDTTAPAARPITSIELPTCARSEEPIDTTSPVDTRRGRVAPETHRVARDDLHGAVGRDQPVLHGEAVPEDAGPGLKEADSQQDQGPQPEPARVIDANPLVDGAPDDGRHHGLRHHPDDSEGHASEDRRLLPPCHPPQVATGGRDIRGARIGEGKVAHDPSTVRIRVMPTPMVLRGLFPGPPTTPGRFIERSSRGRASGATWG